MSDYKGRVSVNGGSVDRTVELITGRTYRVQPLNPQKLKHRDRMCVLLDLVPVSEQHPRDFMAKVRFLDNNRVGRVEPNDLVLVAEE